MDNERNKFFQGILTGLIIAAIVSLSAVLGSMLFFKGSGAIKEESDAYTTGLSADTLTKLEYIERLIKENYALDMVDDAEFEKGVYRGMVAALGDPYSAYYSAEEMQEQQAKLDGVYYGIGASVTIDVESGYPVLADIFEESPALKAGLMTGDLVKEIDGQSVKGMALDKVVALVKGEKDTKVVLLIRRVTESGPEDIEITVKRGSVPRVTVYSSMLDERIAYIGITEFDSVTVDQFSDALATVKGQGMKALILDLRGNPGGNLSAAVDVARKILPEGIVTYTLAKDGARQDYNCDGKNELQVPMVVLVDSKSASASEIVAGAIKDHKKAVLIGTTTYGKGIVQKYINLNDGSSVKLTTSKYYTPNGDNIHGIGIEPDIYIEYDESDKEKDNQVEKAIDYLNKEIE